MAKPRNIEDDIRRLRAEGKTYPEISEELNCSKSTISYHVGKDGTEKERVKGQFSRKYIKQFIRNYKESHPCVDCNEYKDYYVMQFDHLPQYVKCFNISNFYDYTGDVQVVIAEMKKCDLVCGNCHTVRGHNRRVEKAATKVKLDTFIENGLD